MANISDVYGDMSINGNWDSTDITNLLYVLMTQDGHNYFTHFNELDVNNKKGFDDAHKALSNGEELSFYGCGRWTFQTNLERLHDWSGEDSYTDELKELMTSSEYFKRRKQLLTAMKKKDLSIEWDWCEYEPGCAFICVQTGRHFINDEDKLKYDVSESTCYDPTLKNYVEIFMEGADECLEHAIEFISQELGLDIQVWYSKIKSLIKQHPTWYDLVEGFWYFDDQLDSIPEQLGKDVMQLVNEGHV